MKDLHQQIFQIKNSFFLITLSYYCFLRISEVINLKKCDINNNEEKKNFISSSKTDQDHQGVDTYVSCNDSLTCPIFYLDFLSTLNENDYLSNNEYFLRQHLHAVL